MTINIQKQDLIYYYITKKLSSYQIGEIYNCGQSTIMRKMIKHDIPRRTISEAHKGLKHSEETKNKMSEAQKKENNPNWRGDKAGYKALHKYIRRYNPEPECCEICNEYGKKLELSCKDHKYTRNIEDYQYVCRNCHIKYDRENNVKI